MEITFLGMNSVRLTNKDSALLFDPASLDIKVTNDATLLTLPDSPVPAKGGMVIDGPGEYELGGTMITGAPAKRYGAEGEAMEATIYNVVMDGVRVAYLGNVAANLTGEQTETIGQADVLVLPAGGGEGFTATEAATIVSQIEPRYVVPTAIEAAAARDLFLKEIGSSPEPQAKLRVTARDLPLETTTVVLQKTGA